MWSEVGAFPAAPPPAGRALLLCCDGRGARPTARTVPCVCGDRLSRTPPATSPGPGAPPLPPPVARLRLRADRFQNQHKACNFSV